MMTKPFWMYKVTGCGTCPFCKLDQDILEWACTKMKELTITFNLGSLPEWCPERTKDETTSSTM